MRLYDSCVIRYIHSFIVILFPQFVKTKCENICIIQIKKINTPMVQSGAQLLISHRKVQAGKRKFKSTGLA